MALMDGFQRIAKAVLALDDGRGLTLDGTRRVVRVDVDVGGETVVVAVVHDTRTEIDTPASSELSDGRGAESLSPREQEVLNAVAAGHTNRETAAALGLSIKTIEGYRARLMTKLDASSRADLVRHAIARGLLDAWDGREERLLRAEAVLLLGELTAGVVHDIKNVLTAVRTNAVLGAVDARPGDPVSDDLASIQRAAEQGFRMADRLLKHSHSTESNPVAIDMVPWLVDFAAVLRRLVGSHVEVELVVPSGPTFAVVDTVRLERILLNLALNGVDATDGRGVLTLTLSEEDDCVRIGVADTGPGIAPEHLDRVFNAFFTTKPTGTGLGLANARSLAEELGGTLSVTTTGAGGTTFELVLRSAPSAGAESQAG